MIRFTVFDWQGMPRIPAGFDPMTGDTARRVFLLVRRDVKTICVAGLEFLRRWIRESRPLPAMNDDSSVASVGAGLCFGSGLDDRSSDPRPADSRRETAVRYRAAARI